MHVSLLEGPHRNTASVHGREHRVQVAQNAARCRLGTPSHRFQHCCRLLGRCGTRCLSAGGWLRARLVNRKARRQTVELL